MFKASVGYSKNPNSYLSGQETITKALEGLENPKVALVFSSQEYDQNELLNGIKSVTDIPVIGCTSSEAIITNDGIISEPDGQSAAMVFDDPDIRIGYSIIEKGDDARLAGRKLAIDAIKKSNCSLRPSYIYMIATPGDEENYLKGVQDVVGRIPVFGGSAADDEFEGKWKIFCGDKVVDDGCAIVFHRALQAAVIPQVYMTVYEVLRMPAVNQRTECLESLMCRICKITDALHRRMCNNNINTLDTVQCR